MSWRGAECDGLGAVLERGQFVECDGCARCNIVVESPDGEACVAYVAGRGWLYTDGTWRSTTGRVLGRATDRELAEHGPLSAARAITRAA